MCVQTVKDTFTQQPELFSLFSPFIFAICIKTVDVDSASGVVFWFFKIAAYATSFMGQRPEGPEARAGFGVENVSFKLDKVLREFAETINSKSVSFAPQRACVLDEGNAEAQLVLGQMLQFMRVLFSAAGQLRFGPEKIDELLCYAATLQALPTQEFLLKVLGQSLSKAGRRPGTLDLKLGYRLLDAALGHGERFGTRRRSQSARLVFDFLLQWTLEWN